MTKRVAVAMSGGVDSSAAAVLLKERRYDVIGVTMVLPAVYRGGEDGAVGAQAVCDKLGIPFHEIDLSLEFGDQVVEPFLRDYTEGRTPNPCVLCNKSIKFGLLMEKARYLGAEFFSTGHYAMLQGDDFARCLMRGSDRTRDQSYFLWRLDQNVLNRVIFPLGGMKKEDVRLISRQRGFITDDYEGSQDICFLTGRSYREMLKERRPGVLRKGEIRDLNGSILGSHQGVAFYTVGQREGLGISWHEPLYVIRIDEDTNTLVVGPKSGTYRSSLRATDVNWISGRAPDENFRSEVQIRYNQRPASALVNVLPAGDVDVLFDEPQMAVTPGQSSVFYQGNTVLGGGFICK